jgi:hypothetical protein
MSFEVVYWLAEADLTSPRVYEELDGLVHHDQCLLHHCIACIASRSNVMHMKLNKIRSTRVYLMSTWT